MKFMQRQNFRDRGEIVRDVGGWGKRQPQRVSRREFGGMDGTVLYLDRDSRYTIVDLPKLIELFSKKCILHGMII